MFLHKYAQKPIYIFGSFGIFNWLVCFLSALAAVFYKILGLKDFVETPLPVLSMITFLMGGICILMGFLAEIIIRTYHESQNKPIYSIDSINVKKLNAKKSYTKKS